MATVPDVAARILALFREKSRAKGSAEIAVTDLYEVFDPILRLGFIRFILMAEAVED